MVVVVKVVMVVVVIVVVVRCDGGSGSKCSCGEDGCGVGSLKDGSGVRGGVVVEMVVVVILEVRGGSGCGGEGNLIVYVLLSTSSIVFRYV